MCKIRAIRYQCDHVKLRYLSSCRGTYASPNTKAPLCCAGPSLTVTIGDKCRECQYTQFCKGWEGRIAAAESREISARSLSTGLSDDSACSDLDGSDDGWGSAIPTTKAKSVESLELETLRKQFDAEKWNQWDSGRGSSWAGRGLGTYRKRQSSPKSSGDSPLKHVVDVNDLPEPTIDEEEDLPSLEPSYSNDSELDEISEPGSDSELADTWTSSMSSWEELGIDDTNWSKAFGRDQQAVDNEGRDIADEMLPAY
ncbi:MAG: hypothetical protein M1828_004148 [Chrysothrix sp. TS-e1954]|nr:MAG: hypothetical protein M1828_004148 [Chrysothrix sp. TS-e1954]